MSSEVVVNPLRLLRLAEMLPLLSRIISPQRFRREEQEKQDASDSAEFDQWRLKQDEKSDEDLMRPILQQGYLFPNIAQKFRKGFDAWKSKYTDTEVPHELSDIFTVLSRQIQYYDIHERHYIAARIEAAHILNDIPESYLLLAEESATTIAQAAEYLETGSKLSDDLLEKLQSLGATFPEASGVLDALRLSDLVIKQRLGYTYSKIGKFKEADARLLHVYNTDKEDMLLSRINLVYLYFTCDKPAELRGVLRQTSNHIPVSDYFYSVSLCAFQQDNDMVKAMEFFDLIGRAGDFNPQVLPFLLGEKAMPPPPERYAIRSEAEGAVYARNYITIWANSHGALSYLQGYVTNLRPHALQYPPPSDEVQLLDRQILPSVHYAPNPTYYCSKCRAKGAQFRCSRCKGVWYCNQECQKKEWKEHKTYCKQT